MVPANSYHLIFTLLVSCVSLIGATFWKLHMKDGLFKLKWLCQGNIDNI